MNEAYERRDEVEDKSFKRALGLVADAEKENNFAVVFGTFLIDRGREKISSVSAGELRDDEVVPVIHSLIENILELRNDAAINLRDEEAALIGMLTDVVDDNGSEYDAELFDYLELSKTLLDATYEIKNKKTVKEEASE